MDVARFAVSGWEDDLNDINIEEHPHESDRTEILWAAENGNLELVKTLVEKNPSLIHHKDKDGYSPLHRAVSENHIEVVKYLIEQGADVSTKTQVQWQPLHSCCQWSHKEIALLLIQNGADVNALSDGLQTPLHVAASHGVSYDIVQLLLMHPYIKPNLVNSTGETAYDIAKRNSKYYYIFEMADPLLQPI